MRTDYDAKLAVLRDDFVGEYRRLRPAGAADYDRRRGDGMPSWQSLAHRLGASTWPDLLANCGLSAAGLTFSFDSPSLRRLRDLERLINS